MAFLWAMLVAYCKFISYNSGASTGIPDIERECKLRGCPVGRDVAMLQYNSRKLTGSQEVGADVTFL